MCKHEFLSIKSSVASQFYTKYFQVFFWIFVELENVHCDSVVTRHVIRHYTSRVNVLSYIFDTASRIPFKKCAFEGQAKSRYSELDVWLDRRYSRLRDKSGLVKRSDKRLSIYRRFSGASTSARPASSPHGLCRKKCGASTAISGPVEDF